MTDCIVVLVTAPQEDEAACIAQEVVGAKLAACATIVRNVRSVYRWEGKLVDDAEVLMVLKSRPALFPALEQRIRELHSYTVPEIIALPVSDGSAPYLAWLKTEAGG